MNVDDIAEMWCFARDNGGGLFLFAISEAFC